MTGGIESFLAPVAAGAGLFRLAASLQSGGSCALTGLTGSARSLHLLLLQRELRRSFLVVTTGDVETERWEKDLKTWCVWLGADLPRIDSLPALGSDR